MVVLISRFAERLFFFLIVFFIVLLLLFPLVQRITQHAAVAFQIWIQLAQIAHFYAPFPLLQLISLLIRIVPNTLPDNPARPMAPYRHSCPNEI